MKNEVEFEVVWVLEMFSHFEEVISGSGWNISVWLEILHSTRSEKDLNMKFFETFFVSYSLPGFEWNLF